MVLNFILFLVKIPFYNKIYVGKSLITKDIIKKYKVTRPDKIIENIT